MSVTRQPSAYSAVAMSVPAPMRNGAPTLTMSIADGTGDSSQPGVRRRSLQVEVVDSPSSGGRGRPREQRRTEAFDGGAAAFAAGGDGGLQRLLPEVMAGSTTGAGSGVVLCLLNAGGPNLVVGAST